jgi:AmmeMemoRadiSam system protein A
LLRSRKATGLRTAALPDEPVSAVTELASQLGAGWLLVLDERGDYPDALRTERATFVTLRNHDELLGCIGTLRPHRPLVRDVVHNAHHAAFSDPRFTPLTHTQLPGLDLHISVLSLLEPLPVTSEDDLLAKLRPGLDGLLIEEQDHVATFLPAMWPRLITARTFVRALKDKAHLPPDYWSPTIRVFRYTAEEL